MPETLRTKWSQIINRAEYRRIFHNFLSLSTLGALNVLLPLITLPYLVRVLGPEKYGIISFAYALMVYFLMVSNYGFQLSATQLISVSRNDREKTSEIFISVITIRLLLTLAGLVVLIFLATFIHPFCEDPLVYYYSFGIVLGQCLIPTWYFQGIEKMHFVTIINSVPRLIFTVLTFVFIRGPGDYIYVNLLISIGALIGGIASLVLTVSRFGILAKLPSWSSILFYLRYGWHVFISTISISLYRESNTFLLGLFTNYTVVGYYSAAEKILKAIQSVLTPVTESLFPYFSFRFKEEADTRQNINFLNKISKYYGAVLAGISILLLLLAPFIVKLFLGKEYLASILDLRIMSFVIFFGGLNYLFGIIGLINLGRSNYFTRAVLVSGLVSLAITISLAPFLFDRAAALAMLVSEIMLLAQILFVLNRIRNKPVQSAA
jgi:polysaccharide transporter, PST family